MTFKTTAHAALGGLFIATASVLLAQPAMAQSAMCKNGLPEWAAKAYSGRHQGGFLCEPVTTRRVVRRPDAGQTMREVRPAVRPSSAAIANSQRPQPASKAATETAVRDDGGPTSNTIVAKSQTCRIYLPSTGQTVDAPCER